jgi:hypothetical protein
MNARFGRPAASLKAHPNDYPKLDEKNIMPERQLAQMLASALLDPTSSLPMDSKTLHDRVRVYVPVCVRTCAR